MSAVEQIEIAVCGAHLSGMALNHQLLDRGAILVAKTSSSPDYRLFALPGEPPRTGLVKVATGGAAIALEVWQLPAASLGGFLQGIPAPLGLGKVSLQDGRQVVGFICEAIGVEGARDITAFGGWRAYIASAATAEPIAESNALSRKDLALQALPVPTSFALASTALIVIDMQRDFIAAGGFGEVLGNDPTLLQQVVAPCRELIAAARAVGMMIIHTREGHSPDLADLAAEKLTRAQPGKRIGDPGPMGRILIRGEYGHDFIDELTPLPAEVVIDKPGKGSFYHTGLDTVLRSAAIKTLLVCGVTTEVCVQTTAREANDRGYRVIVVEDCCASYFPEFHATSLAMIASQGGIVGFVAGSGNIIAAMADAENA